MYEVALSFASEQREYAEGVATALQSRGISVFYDDFEKIELWGKDLTEEFQAIFERGSDAVVFFVSKAWVEKPWPRIERRFALSRAVGEPEFDVLPVRFDDTPVPGLAESVAYICAQHYSPAELASMIAERLGVKPFEGKASDVPPPRMTSRVGEVVLDYSNHNGRYLIGKHAVAFETRWSKASNVCIHVYNDPPSINGIALGLREWTAITQVVNAGSLDYSSRRRSPRVGQIVVFRNCGGFYAAARVLKIKDDSRGDDHDELRFEYAIQADGSDNFATFAPVE